jgi:hypothetical protein
MGFVTALPTAPGLVHGRNIYRMQSFIPLCWIFPSACTSFLPGQLPWDCGFTNAAQRTHPRCRSRLSSPSLWADASAVFVSFPFFLYSFDSSTGFIHKEPSLTGNHLAGEGTWDGRLCCYLYCHKTGLVTEVDGDIHDLQQEEDEPLRPLRGAPPPNSKFMEFEGGWVLSGVGF